VPKTSTSTLGRWSPFSLYITISFHILLVVMWRCVTVGGKIGESGNSVLSAESSLWPAMSIGKSVVLNYLTSSSEQTQSPTVGKYWFCHNFQLLNKWTYFKKRQEKYMKYFVFWTFLHISGIVEASLRNMYADRP